MSLLIRDPVLYGSTSPSCKAPVRVATTAAGTLSTSFATGSTVDGIVLATGDRLLIKNQVTASENGLYVVQSSGAPLRAPDLPVGIAAVGVTVYVTSGTANAITVWTCTSAAAIVGVSTLSFIRSDAIGVLPVSRGGLGISDVTVDGTLPIGDGAGNYVGGLLGAGAGVLVTVDSDAGSVAIGVDAPITTALGGTGTTESDQGGPETNDVFIGDTSGTNYNPGQAAGANFTFAGDNTNTTALSALEQGSYLLTTAASLSCQILPDVCFQQIQTYDFKTGPDPASLLGETDEESIFTGQQVDINLADTGVAGIQVTTDRGTFLLGEPFAPQRTARMLWNPDGSQTYASIGYDNALTWFVTAQGPMIGPVDTGADRWATSIAISANGDMILVGSFASNQAWYSILTGNGTWSTPTLMPDPTEVADLVQYGWSAALSADGFTAAVGDSGFGTSDTCFGAAWIFTYNADTDTWTQQGDFLQAPDDGDAAGQATALTFSTDGNTLTSGSPFTGTNSQSGSFWVFTRSADVWTQQGGKNSPTNTISDPVMCNHGAFQLSSDGNTLLTGGPGESTDSNSSFVVWQRIAGTWSQLQLVTSFAGSVGSNVFAGQRTSISGDGNTIAIAGAGDNSGKGAIWVYTRPGFGQLYTLQGAKIKAGSIPGTTTDFGRTVWLSATGNTMFATCESASPTNPSILVCNTRYNGIWTQQGTGIVGANDADLFIASDADGRTVIICYSDTNTVGVPVFT